MKTQTRDQRERVTLREIRKLRDHKLAVDFCLTVIARDGYFLTPKDRK